MKKQVIQGAEFKRYNANTTGKASPDCVKRAISMAFNIPYAKVGQALNKLMHEKRKQVWNIPAVYEDYILSNGGSKPIQVIGEPLKVDEWADQHPEGAYILETSKAPTKILHGGNHLTCVIDNVLYDSWDSSHQYVVCYYECNNSRKVVEGDINEHASEVSDFMVEKLTEYANTQLKKYGYADDGKAGHVKFYIYRVTRNAYVYKAYCTVEITDENTDVDEQFQIAFSFSPETSFEAAKAQIQKEGKIRMYDRMYAVNKIYKDQVELAKERRAVSEELGHNISKGYMTPQEKKFYNTLPPKIKARMTYISIQNPGQYHDSYSITFHPLQGDPRSPEKVKLEGYDAKQIRQQIDKYLNENFARPYDDYDVYEEIY